MSGRCPTQSTRQHAFWEPPRQVMGLMCAQHQNHTPVFCFDRLISDETSACVGAACAMIFNGRVYGDGRRTLGTQHIGELAKEHATVAAPDHLGHPDECVNRCGVLGKMRQMGLRPRLYRVSLHICEG